MAKHVRMSITVPVEIKERMDAVEDPPSWSAVASRAFQAELAEIVTRKGVRAMEDVIARLRASKQKMAEGRFKEGFRDGEKWAETRAEAEELSRLESLYDSFSQDEWKSFFERNGSPSDYSSGERLVNVIKNPMGRPNQTEVRDLETEARDFWDEVDAKDDAQELRFEPAYVRGFAEGALTVWKSVKDRL